MPDDEQKTDPEPPKTGAEAAAAPPESEGQGERNDERDEAEATGAPGGDKFHPEDIAARVGSIGEESEADRIASEEEKKLLERRREQKKGGKKGLQTAASKRLAKIGEGTVKRPSSGLAGAVTPEADPLLERAAVAQKWIRDHSQLFGGMVTVAVLGVAGFLGWTYWQDKRNDDASAMLSKAFADEHGRVSDKEADDDDEHDSPKAKQLYPTFKSAGERRDAALAQYRAVESKYPGTGAAILARLAEASLLLDAGDAKGALDAYGDVRGSALAQADAEVRGRAIEGIGFADELLSQAEGADKGKTLDAALAAYRDLAQVDVKGLKELGLYHEARVVLAKGDKAKAIELLKEAHKLVSEPGDEHSFSYLEFVVEDRLRELDPSALPPKAAKAPPGLGLPPGAEDNPQIQEILRKLKEQHQGGGGPMAPVPMPGAPK